MYIILYRYSPRKPWFVYSTTYKLHGYARAQVKRMADSGKYSDAQIHFIPSKFFEEDPA